MDFTNKKEDNSVIGRDLRDYPHTPEGDAAFSAKLYGSKALYPQNESMSVPEYNKQEALRLKAIADRGALGNGPVTLSNVSAPAGAINVGDGIAAYRSPMVSSAIDQPKTDEQIYQETHAQYKDLLGKLKNSHNTADGNELLTNISRVGSSLKDMTLRRKEQGLALNPYIVDTGDGTEQVRPEVAAIGAPGPSLTPELAPGIVSPVVNRASVVASAFPSSLLGIKSPSFEKVRKENKTYIEKILGE